ncbi:hypothetical protein NGRA_2751 [Nosema granulosis]|uniref:HTH CENPB-type domain-containing protein n=1 Tax=Nosema granulosis TaxID=83296 RepID=A0A9P6GXG4_9MICR|nr:hypothetical protein NGRA_2751 [Nosema granulosis]
MHSGDSSINKQLNSANLNSLLYRWLLESRQMNITVTTDSLQTKALEIAKKFNIKDFKASTGLVCKFVKRDKITQKELTEMQVWWTRLFWKILKRHSPSWPSMMTKHL